MNHHLRPTLFLALLCLVLTSADARLYRWVDDDGNVHYSDKIPPSQADQGHDKLSTKGIRIDTVAPALTQQEIEREKELERQRKQRERLIAEQRAADRSLLSTYRSVDDLVMAQSGQLAAVDVMILPTKDSIRRQQEWLRGLRFEAANLERAGKALPQSLEDKIAAAADEITGSYATIVSREQQKQEIREGFDRDIRRFAKLKDLPDEALDDVPAPVLPNNLVGCGSRDACAASWQRAADYVRTHASTPVLHVGDTLVINEPPIKDGDVSLALALIRDDKSDGASLYLDLQCRRFETSEAACKTELGAGALDGFRAAVTD